MSKAFLWFGLLISAFLLFIGLTSSKGIPTAAVLWAVIFVVCFYKLFLAKPKTS
ncbi:MAG TPA: hypothetical protein VFZ49_03875 [Pyrinomonadaceae bacterium]